MENNSDIIYTEEDRTVLFESHRLSKVKINAIYHLGNNTVDVMNDISEYVVSNWNDFFDSDKLSFVSCKTFITMIRSAFPKVLSNTFDSETYKIIHTGYVNKVESIRKHLVIREKQVRDILYYKKTTTKYETDENGKKVKVVKNPGDVREIRYKWVDTDKTKVLSYLAKFGNEKILDWMKEQLSSNIELSSQKRSMYLKYIKTIEQFGFEVLLKEALEHRKKVFDEYLKPCIFVSNTLHLDSRFVETFKYNKKKKSIVHAYMNIAVPYDSNKEHKSMVIPIKINKKYHGDLNQYNSSKDNNHIYMVCCIDKPRRVVDFYLSRKQLVAHRAPTDDDIYSAFDLNTNGDKIVGTNDVIISHKKDDELVSIISEMKKALQSGLKREKKRAKKHGSKYKSSNAMSNRKTRKYKKLSSVMKEHNKLDIAKAISEEQTNGTNHIIMENLTGSFGKTKAKDTDNDLNFNDKTSSMQLSSIKDYALGICRNKHMSFTLVQPEYTSQRCPICGSIHKENRLKQDKFECVECGYTFNADKNATDNMIHRVVSKELCEKLLQKTKDGYVPKKSISHDMLLDIISLSSCNTLQNTCYSVRKEDTLKSGHT